jgi:hypothetical protein
MNPTAVILDAFCSENHEVGNTSTDSARSDPAGTWMHVAPKIEVASAAVDISTRGTFMRDAVQ